MRGVKEFQKLVLDSDWIITFMFGLVKYMLLLYRYLNFDRIIVGKRDTGNDFFYPGWLSFYLCCFVNDVLDKVLSFGFKGFLKTFLIINFEYSAFRSNYYLV